MNGFYFEIKMQQQQLYPASDIGIALYDNQEYFFVRVWRLDIRTEDLALLSFDTYPEALEIYQHINAKLAITESLFGWIQ